ncbi:MAG: phosphotransferase [Chloroflexi bacterium]|nr:phosphotransferase [Chloroflexota bacterium]MBP8055863.1 phosphotransferase [Chloroflexota bacterium]
MRDVRVLRSFIAPDSLAEIINDEYVFDTPVTCKMFSKLLRTQDNDHYQVKTAGQKYVARIYQPGERLMRHESDYLFELDWLTFLRDRGCPVSYPIRRRDGGYLGKLNAPEGLRYYALFSFASGEPMSEHSEDQFYRIGEKMAHIHIASNEYNSTHGRQLSDLAFLVDRPLERIKLFWNESDFEDLDLLVTSAEEAKEEITRLLGSTPTNDAWGVIGGDFHSTNVHFDETGNPTFFNFDLCSYGWRAYDIATFLANTNLLHAPVEYSEAFFAGYYSVRPLTQAEHQAIEPFLTIRRIWLMGSFAVKDGMAGYTFMAQI